MTDFNIQWHDSAKSVHDAYWQPVADDAGLSLEELLDGSTIGTVSLDGKESEEPADAMLIGITSMGCWGFADTKNRVIHAWAEPTANPELVMEILGHELGHLTGTPCKEHMEEELRADQYGQVAAAAFRLYMLQPVKARQS